MSKKDKPTNAFDLKSIKAKVKSHDFTRSKPEPQFYIELLAFFKPESFDSGEPVHKKFFNGFAERVKSLTSLYDDVLEHRFCDEESNKIFFENFKNTIKKDSGHTMIRFYCIFYWYHLTENILAQHNESQQSSSAGGELLAQIKEVFNQLNTKEQAKLDAKQEKRRRKARVTKLSIGLVLIVIILVLHFSGVIELFGAGN